MGTVLAELRTENYVCLLPVIMHHVYTVRMSSEYSDELFCPTRAILIKAKTYCKQLQWLIIEL